MKNKVTFLSLGSLLAAMIFVLVMAVPVFAGAPIMNDQALTIPEGSLSGTFTTPNKIVVFDPEGDHLNGKLTFDVLSGDGQPIFDVGSSTGIVTLKAGQVLDYETKKSYTLTVKVQDMESLTATATITINVKDVSDESPVMNDQSFTIPENSPNNTLVGKIAFTDIDVNDTHTFSVLSGNGSGDGAFQIATNGNITVKDTTQLNYEAQTKFVLNVKIQDFGGQQDTADITINLTNVNEKPVISNQTFNGLSENANNGANVGTVVATDPDGDTLEYLRTSGSAAFAINATTGQVTVANSSLLNFETNPSPTFVVTVNDGMGQSATATITVNLVDVNDPPRVTGSGIPDVIVNEGTTSATRNLWAAFEDDEDADNQLTFAVVGNDNPGLFSSPPLPNNETPVLLTLNFADGATGIANITVRAFDTDGAHVDDTFKVDFNEAPVAKGYGEGVTVLEDAANTTLDLAAGFTDAEQPSSELTYTIVLNTNEGLFSSVDINGASLVLDYAPDANGQANITIKATDVGGLSAQTILKVRVIPVNDKPTTSGIADVNVEEDAPNKVIDLTKVFDDKEDGAAGLTYEVKNNTNPGLFDDVVVNQGTLTLDFKANTSGTAQLTIRATDKGVPGNPGTNEFVETTFTVNVAAVNDLPVLSDIAINIDEDQSYKFTAADFTAHFTDADGDPLVNVRIQSLPTQGTLKLGPDNVTLNQVISAALLKDLAFFPALNWDSGSTSFTWNASDGAAYATVAAKVTITVGAVNDAPVVANVNKSGPEGVNILFKQTDFSSAFTDVDGDPLVKIKIISLPANGTLKLGDVNVSANDQITVGSLDSLRYVPNEYFYGEDKFDWAGFDGQEYSLASAQVILTITPENDPPTLDLNGDAAGTGFSAIFAAGKSPVKVTSQNVTITDIDDTMMEGATIIIVNRVHGTKEILDATVAGTNITKSFSSASGVLTLSGADTLANYEKVLETVTFKIDADLTNPDTTVIRNISFRVYDGEENSNDAISKVTVINPRIKVTMTPKIQTVAKGNVAVFTVTIENTGSVALTNIQVSSANVPDCNRTIPGKLEAGQSLEAFACLVTDVQARIDNEITVKALEPNTQTQVSADADAVVRVLQNISINIAPDPAVGNTLVKGQNAVFNVTVVNPSEADLTNVEVKAFVDYDLVALGIAMPAAPVPATACDKVIGNLGPGKETTYSCTISNVQASFEIEVEVSALIDGITQTADFDIDEISVINMTLEVFAVPFELLAGEVTPVEFNMTLANVSNVPLTLSTLVSNLHGNLLDGANGNVTANTCPGLNLTIPAGEVRTCAYEVSLMLQSAALTNVVTAGISGGNGQQLTVVDEALVSVAEFSPLVVVVNADPPSVVAPGGLVNLHVQVTNNTTSELTLDALNDSILGGLDGEGSCEVPQTIQGNASYSCTYTVKINGKAGDVVMHTVTAIADTKEASNSAAVQVTAGAQTRMLLPSISSISRAGEPNNSVSTALTLSTGLTYYFYADDATDWYKVTLSSPARLKVKLSGFATAGQLVVYHTIDKPIGHNGDTGIVPNREIDVGVQQPGTYYIWVITNEPSAATSDMLYSLRVEATAP